MEARDKELVVYSEMVDFNTFMEMVKKKFPDGCLFPEGECPYRRTFSEDATTVFLKLNTDDPLDAINSMSNLFFVDTNTGLDVAELKPVQNEDGEYGYKVTYESQGVLLPQNLNILLTPLDEYAKYKSDCDLFNIEDFEYRYTNEADVDGNPNQVYLHSYKGTGKNIYIPSKEKIFDDGIMYDVFIDYNTNLTTDKIKEDGYYNYNIIYQWNKNPFFKNSYDIENVIINEGVEIICNGTQGKADFLLSFLPRLIYGKIPNTLFSANYIFMNDISLKCYGGIVIPQLAEGMFFGCESLEDISYLKYPNNKESLNSDDYSYKADMFFGCYGLKNNTTLGFYKVYNHGIYLNGFMRNTNITEYTLPDCKNIVSYHNMLADCDYLERVDGILDKYAIDISNFLKGSIHVSGKIRVDCIWFGEEFFNKENAFSVNIPTFKDDMYRTLVLIPRKYNRESLKEYVNNDLDYLSCRVFLQDFIENYDYEIVVEEDLFDEVIRYISLNKYKGDINRLYIPDTYNVNGIEYSVRINNTCFSRNTNIKYLAMGDNVVFRNLQEAFYECTNLRIGLDLVGPPNKIINANNVYTNCENLSNYIHIDTDTVSIDEETNAFINLGELCKFKLNFDTEIIKEETEDGEIIENKIFNIFTKELISINKLEYNGLNIAGSNHYTTLNDFDYKIDKDNKIITLLSLNNIKSVDYKKDIYELSGDKLRMIFIPHYTYINGEKYYIYISKSIFSSNKKYINSFYDEAILFKTDNSSFIWSNYIIKIVEDNLDEACINQRVDNFSILLPNTIKTMKRMFYNSNSLMYCNISKYVDGNIAMQYYLLFPIPYGVEDVSYCFATENVSDTGVNNTIIIPPLPNSIKNMSYMFYNRMGLFEIDDDKLTKVCKLNIPHSIEYLDFAFYDEKIINGYIGNSNIFTELYDINSDYSNHYMIVGDNPSLTSKRCLSNMPLFFLKSANSVFSSGFIYDTLLEISSNDIEIPSVWIGNSQNKNDQFILIDKGNIDYEFSSIIEREDKTQFLFHMIKICDFTEKINTDMEIVFIYESELNANDFKAVHSQFGYGIVGPKVLNNNISIGYGNIDNIELDIHDIDNISVGARYYIIGILLKDGVDDIENNYIQPEDFILKDDGVNKFDLFKFVNTQYSENKLKLLLDNGNYPRGMISDLVFTMNTDYMYNANSNIKDNVFISSKLNDTNCIVIPYRGVSGLNKVISPSTFIDCENTFDSLYEFINSLYPNWTYGYNELGQSLEQYDSFGEKTRPFDISWRGVDGSMLYDEAVYFISIPNIDMEYELLYRIFIEYGKYGASNNVLYAGIMLNYSDKPSTLVQAVGHSSKNVWDAGPGVSTALNDTFGHGSKIISSNINSGYNDGENITSKDLLIFVNKRFIDEGIISSISVQQQFYQSNDINEDTDKEDNNYYMKVSFSIHPNEWIGDKNNKNNITSRYYAVKQVLGSKSIAQISYEIKTNSHDDYRLINNVVNGEDQITVYTKGITIPNDIISVTVIFEAGDEYGIISPPISDNDLEDGKFNCKHFLCPSHICQLYGAYWYACYYGYGDKMFDDIKRSLLTNIQKKFKFINMKTGEDVTPEKLFIVNENNNENLITLMKSPDGGFLLKMVGCHPNEESPFINDSLMANGIDFDIILKDNSVKE